MLAAGGLGSCLVRPFTAAMTVQNTAGFFPADVLLAKIPHRLARGPGGLPMVTHRSCVGVAAEASLLCRRHQPGGVNHLAGAAGQLRNRATDSRKSLVEGTRCDPGGGGD